METNAMGNGVTLDVTHCQGRTPQDSYDCLLRFWKDGKAFAWLWFRQRTIEQLRNIETRNRVIARYVETLPVRSQ